MKKKLLFVSLIICCVLAGCGKKEIIQEEVQTGEQAVLENENISENTDIIEEDLPQIVEFKGAEGVTVVCPEGYEVKSLEDRVVEFGTIEKADDEYLDISVELLESTDYDDYMVRGQYMAETYMKKLLCDKIVELYGDNILYIIGCNFIDGESYWDISGIVYIDGSEASPQTEEELVSSIELRYTGPDGFIIMTRVTALDKNMAEYATAAGIIHNSVETGTKWTSSPKEIPSIEDLPDVGKQISSDRSGKNISLIMNVCSGNEESDISEVFYWKDKDDDIWFFDGVSNEFIGFSSDVYIKSNEICAYDTNEWTYESPFEFEYYDYYDAWEILGYEGYFDSFEGYYEYYDGSGVYDDLGEDDEDWDDDWDEDDSDDESWDDDDWEDDEWSDDEDWEDDVTSEDDSDEDDWDEDDSDDDESWDDEDWEDDEEWVED